MKIAVCSQSNEINSDSPPGISQSIDAIVFFAIREDSRLII